MRERYTLNPIISYLYDECSYLRKLEIEHWLEENSTVSDQYAALKQAKQSLPKVLFRPAQSSIDTILTFSRMSDC